MHTTVRAAVAGYVQKVRAFSPNARLFLVNTALASAQSGVFQVVLALYVVELGHGRDFLGVMTGLGAFATGLASLPAAVVSGITGHRRALVFGTAVATFGAFGISLSVSPIWLLASQACLGSGVSFVFANTAPFLAGNSRETERTYLFSVQGTLMLAVAVLGNSLGGNLPEALRALMPGLKGSAAASFRATMIIGASLLGVSAIPLLLMKEPGDFSRRRSARVIGRLPSRESSHHTKIIGRLVLTSVLTSFGAGLMIPFLPVFLTDRGASLSLVGFIFAGTLIMTTVGTLAAPMVADRWGKVRTVALTQAASVPFLVAVSLREDLRFVIPALLVRGALMNMGGPIDGTFSMEIVDPETRAAVSSLRGMAWNLSWAAGSTLGGVMIERYGYTFPFLTTATLYLASAVLYVLFFSKLEEHRVGQGGAYPPGR